MIDVAAASESISQFQAWQLWFHSVDITDKTLLFGLSVRNCGRIGKCLQAFAALTIVLDIIGAPAVRRFGYWLKELTTLAKAKTVTVVGLQLLGDGIFPNMPALFRLDHINKHTRTLVSSLVICCNPRTKRQKRVVTISRSFRRVIPSLIASKKGQRRLARWRARVFPASVKLQHFEKKVLLPAVLVVSASFAITLYLFAFSNEYPETFLEGFIVAVVVMGLLFLVIAFCLGLILLALHIIVPFILLVSALLASVLDAILVEPTAWVISHRKNENLIKGLSIIVFLIGFYFDLLAS